MIYDKFVAGDIQLAKNELVVTEVGIEHHDLGDCIYVELAVGKTAHARKVYVSLSCMKKYEIVKIDESDPTLFLKYDKIYA
jgi:hypothetical protein